LVNKVKGAFLLEVFSGT